MIIEKTSAYHTVNGNCALLQTSKTAKIVKGQNERKIHEVQKFAKF